MKHILDLILLGIIVSAVIAIVGIVRVTIALYRKEI